MHWIKYYQLGEHWDHDHCAACGTMFCLHEKCDSQKEGYAVTEDYQLGEDYEWVCRSCFEELKDILDWKNAPLIS